MVRYATLIVALVLVVGGCATTGSQGTAAAVPITDVSMLAGHWSGWVESPVSSSRVITAIRPDGSFTGSSMAAGATDAAGMFTVKDGKAYYQIAGNRTVGIFAAQSGTMTLSQRNGKKMLDGTSDDGKVKFQLTSVD